MNAHDGHFPTCQNCRQEESSGFTRITTHAVLWLCPTCHRDYDTRNLFEEAAGDLMTPKSPRKKDESIPLDRLVIKFLADEEFYPELDIPIETVKEVMFTFSSYV